MSSRTVCPCTSSVILIEGDVEISFLLLPFVHSRMRTTRRYPNYMSKPWIYHIVATLIKSLLLDTLLPPVFQEFPRQLKAVVAVHLTADRCPVQIRLGANMDDHHAGLTNRNLDLM